MPVKWIVGVRPHAATRPEDGPRRLSRAASLVAAAGLAACLAAVSASAAPARPAKAATVDRSDAAAVPLPTEHPEHLHYDWPVPGK